MEGFWKGFGRQKSRISQFLEEKFEAKIKMIFGRLKNRILRLQKQIAGEVRRSVRVRGKEQKGIILEASFRGRQRGLWHKCLTRTASLWEAADVLRTYRRAARGEPKAKEMQTDTSCSNSCVACIQLQPR